MSNSPLKLRHKSTKKKFSVVERFVAKLNRKRRHKGGYVDKRKKSNQ